MAHELSHEFIRTEAMSRLSSCKQRRKATGFANAASCRLSSGLPQIKLYMYFYYWFSLDEFCERILELRRFYFLANRPQKCYPP